MILCRQDCTTSRSHQNDKNAMAESRTTATQGDAIKDLASVAIKLAAERS